MFDTNKQDKDREVQDLGKWGSEAGYKLGFLAGSAGFGLLFGVILGAFFIGKYSKNEGLRHITEAVSKRAQQNQISLEDLDNLSAGRRISGQEDIRIAIFIDGLEDKLGSLKDGIKVGDNYTFTKTVEPNGVINYTIEDGYTDRVATSFDLDRDGKITVQSRNDTEAVGKLNQFVILNADRASVNVNENISLYADEASQAAILEKQIKSLETLIEALNRIDLTRLATSSESAQSQYIKSQDELNHQLSELKVRVKAIADQIHTAEVANHKESQRHPANTLLAIKISCLVDKLVGLDRQIDTLQTDLQIQPQTVNEIKAYRQKPRVENTASTSEINALKQEISQLQNKVKVLTAQEPVSNKQQFRSLASLQETNPQYVSFSEENEYPNLPTDLSELQVSESPANGQPITIVEAETQDYAELQGMEH